VPMGTPTMKPIHESPRKAIGDVESVNGDGVLNGTHDVNPRGELTMCKSIKASCRCHFNQDHTGPHECECFGSWMESGEIIQFPQLYIGDTDDPRPPIDGERDYWINP